MSVDCLLAVLCSACQVGLKDSMFRVMLALTEGRASIYALAARTRLSHEGVRKGLVRLRECGEVAVSVNEDNVYVHYLTEQGEATVRRVLSVMEEDRLVVGKGKGEGKESLEVLSEGEEVVIPGKKGGDDGMEGLFGLG